MQKIALALSTALLATTLAVPALADSAVAKSVTIDTRGLDLSSQAGVELVYSRIRSASREACREAESRSAARVVEHRQCVRTAMDSGVMAANNEALSALHLAKTGHAPSLAAK
jgi:UrcA family protein